MKHYHWHIRYKAVFGWTLDSVPYTSLAACIRGIRSAKSYEAIRREDGILVLAHDGMYIGSEWLALLPLSESIESLFDAETQTLLAKEREAERIAWEVQP